MRFTIILFLLFSLFACSPVFKYVDEYDPIIYGKPKKIETITYKVKVENDSSYVKEFAFSEISLYDKKGREKESFSYNSGGKRTSRDVVNYNKKNRKIEYVSFNNKDEIVGNYAFGFDNKYRKINYISYNRGEMSVRKEFKYINETDFYEYSYDKNDSLKYIGLVIFNEHKKIQKVISYNPDKTLKSTIEMIFNEEGNEIEQNWYNSEHKLTSNHKRIAYDSNNNLIHSEKYTPNSSSPISSTKFKYLYDEYNNIVYRELYTNDKLGWIKEIKYTYYK